jgi:hypothetical protein
MRLFKKILLIAVLLLAAVAGVIAWKIGPRNVIGMLRYDQRKEGSLKVGDHAPDVSLVSLDGKSPVRLSEHVGSKPLILVFGSYT